jgi:hypothetical protein
MEVWIRMQSLFSSGTDEVSAKFFSSSLMSSDISGLH